MCYDVVVLNVVDVCFIYDLRDAARFVCCDVIAVLMCCVVVFDVVP